MSEEVIHREGWRYVVLVAKIGKMFLVQGIAQSIGILIPPMVFQLQSDYATVGFVVSLKNTMYFLTCPLANIVTTRFSSQIVCFIGGLASGLCFIGSAFANSVVGIGCLFFMAGSFSSPLLQSSYITFRQHFDDKFGVANTFALMFGVLGGILLPFVIGKLFQCYGLHGTLLCLGGLLLNLAPIGATFRPPRNWRPENEDDRVVLIQNESGPSTSTMYLADQDSRTLDDSGHVPASTCQRAKESILTALNFYALKNEPMITLLLLPSQLLLDFVRMGWFLFVVSYAVSLGWKISEAVFFPMIASIGGCVGLIFLFIVLYCRPGWGAQMLAFNVAIAVVSLFIQSWYWSWTTLMVTSFSLGWGLYGAVSSNYATIAATASTANYPGVTAVSFLITGIAVACSGFLTGYLYEMTRSFCVVFRILACSLTVSLALSCVYIYIRIFCNRSSRRP